MWLWKSLGCTRQSSPYMRNVLIGAQSHCALMLLLRQVRTLAKRNLALRNMGLEVHRAPLDEMVEKGLESLGWTFSQSKWSHPLFEQGFDIDEMVQDQLWGHASHFIRESYRQVSFEQLKQAKRHDAAEIGEICYDPRRRQLALRWAGADFTAIMLLLGAMASPFQRKLVGYDIVQMVCPTCGTVAPGWEHLWECFCGFVPSDGLLKRFIWPRTERDLPLCRAFLQGFKALRVEVEMGVQYFGPAHLKRLSEEEGRCAHEEEDVPMKGRCANEGEDALIKRKMCQWRGRCGHEDVAILVSRRLKTRAFAKTFRESKPSTKARVGTLPQKMTPA